MLARVLGLLIAFAALLPLPARATGTTVSVGDAYATITPTTVTVGNATFFRRWRFGGGSSLMVDQRPGAHDDSSWGSNELTIETPAGIGVNTLRLTDASASATPDAVEVALTFSSTPGATIERHYRVLPGVAGIRTNTTLVAAAGTPLTRYSLDSASAPIGVSPPAEMRTVAFNGGADWHDAYDYAHPQIHTDPFDANAEWMEETSGRIGMLLERRNYFSSRMRNYGSSLSAGVDLSYDGMYLGPIEPYSVPNPAPVLLRARTVPASGRLELEPVIVALGTSVDDLRWNAWKLLQSDMRAYPQTINFNTDRIHTAGVDVGARDGVNQAVFDQLVPVAKSLGVETFVLDDGWQKYNGDWNPDPARWPNGFQPVRDTLETNGMRLGLWMAPQNFHPDGATFKAHKAWTCLPTGAALAAYNTVDKTGGSNAAGVGIFDFNALDDSGRFIDHLHDDIKRLTDDFHVGEFKYDFSVWTDCAHGNIYANHDTFTGMLDTLGSEEPGTGFGMDETNDFRGFPYESILRGPTWFQNGNPPQDALLHNVWSMASLVPGYAIGQSVTINKNDSVQTIDEKMAVALAYHMTFWSDIRTIAGADQQYLRDRVRMWTDFSKTHRSLAGFAYPLLADPLGRAQWSGLQPWDAASNRGHAMLYRFDAANATQTVAFHATRAGVIYRITDITPGSLVNVIGDFDGAALTAGIAITIPQAKSARILQIDPL